MGIVHRFGKWYRIRKNRYLIYLATLAAISIYLILFLDFNRFYNVEKTYYSLGSQIALKDFENIIGTISPDNMLQSNLLLSNGEPYLQLDGFENEWLDEKNSRIQKRNALHPTLNLALFSMGYASGFFLKHYKKNALGASELDILEKVYLYVYNETVKPYSFNSMSVNDHAVSERIQFIVLFNGYLLKYHPEKAHLIKCLSRDFRICMGFLMNGRHFTWQTNHGIMQLRSMAQMACIIDREDKRESILEIVNRRLKEVVPYHVGEDGAIYEAAPGYWFYIYNQLEKIAVIPCIDQLESRKLIEDMLPDASRFLKSVASNDGFLQGMGDSYSQYIPPSPGQDPVQENRYFWFSNQLTGANWTSGKYHFNVLFSSLHAPLEVHKLPEDLAVYLYINQPLFSNTGIYTYNLSEERLFFETEKSQSTVMFADTPFPHPVSSQVDIAEYQEEQGRIVFLGRKSYPGDLRISRKVTLDLEKGVSIRDESKEGQQLVSYYNIHPLTEVRKISGHEVQLLAGDSMAFRFTSSEPLALVEGIISEKKEQLTTIQRLMIEGNPIQVEISFPETGQAPVLERIMYPDSPYNRAVISERLERAYGNMDGTIRIKRNFTRRALLLAVILLVFISLIEFYYYRTGYGARS